MDGLRVASAHKSGRGVIWDWERARAEVEAEVEAEGEGRCGSRDRVRSKSPTVLIIISVNSLLSYSLHLNSFEKGEIHSKGTGWPSTRRGTGTVPEASWRLFGLVLLSPSDRTPYSTVQYW